MRVRDLLKPKSSEDIKRALMQITPERFFNEIYQMVTNYPPSGVRLRPLNAMLKAWKELQREPIKLSGLQEAEVSEWEVGTTSLGGYTVETKRVVYRKKKILADIIEDSARGAESYRFIEWGLKKVRGGFFAEPSAEELERYQQLLGSISRGEIVGFTGEVLFCDPLTQMSRKNFTHIQKSLECLEKIKRVENEKLNQIQP